MLLRWLLNWRGRQGPAHARTIPDALWRSTLQDFPFLSRHGPQSLDALRTLAGQFLAHKEFHGAGGLEVTDRMAVAIAAQACLPVLAIAGPRRGLDWYDDFVGIVVHRGAVLAPRESTDDAGVVHAWQEELSGEAMPDGPVTLSWEDVADAGASAEQGYNVVVHEFVHKIDMRDGAVDGCPPLPAGFMGSSSAAHAHSAWLERLQASYLDYCDKLSLAERFGGAPVWLDSYAAVSPEEFFAVASEAYFVSPAPFARDFAALVPMFDAFFGAVTPAV
jgi:Mlc titration factor MtfA (ptsG expression regulator)